MASAELRQAAASLPFFIAEAVDEATLFPHSDYMIF